MLLSASWHSARRVSRALAPASNCLRIRCRSSSACGPSTDKGVREPCMFRSGWLSGFRPGRAAVVTSLERVLAALLIPDPDGFFNPRLELLTFAHLARPAWL